MTGFWALDVKPFGPVQEYVVIPEGPPVRVNDPPTQTGPLFEAVVLGKGFTTTNPPGAHADAPHPFSHRAKYVVVPTPGAGIVNGLPDPIKVVPQPPEYQLRVNPEPPVAVRVIFATVPRQNVFGTTDTEVGGCARSSTVTVTLLQPDCPHPFSQDTK
jgi:hypothetical protein